MHVYAYRKVAAASATLARAAVVRIIARFSLAPSTTSHPSFDLFSLAELSVCVRVASLSRSLSHPISFRPRYTCWRLCECTRGRPRDKSICPSLYIVVPCGCLSLTLSLYFSLYPRYPDKMENNNNNNRYFYYYYYYYRTGAFYIDRS